MADRDAGELVPLTLSVTATDPDLPPDLLTYELLEGPEGLILGPVTGVVSWTPPEVTDSETAGQIGLEFNS